MRPKQSASHWKQVRTCLLISLSNTIEFLRLYADRCHHGKEEALLFRELEKKGMPRAGGPVGMMLMEYQAGRSLIAPFWERLRW